MKVFLSWSGEKSRAVALALRDWLPRVINEVEPFMSSRDIAAGVVWQTEIATQLDATRFGIVCVTSENQDSRWLNFEAGALAKEVGKSRLVPLAIDLTPINVEPPLGQYQAKGLSKAEILEVLQSLNAQCDKSLPDSMLEDACNQWWSRLESKLEEIEASHPIGAPIRESERPTRDLLEEILTTVRALQSATAPPSPARQALVTAVAATRAAQVRAERIAAVLRPVLPDVAQIHVPADPGDSVLIVSDKELPEGTRKAVLEVAGAGRFPVDFIFTGYPSVTSE